MVSLCLGLTNPEVLECKYCGKLYHHKKNYHEHISKHDGIKRFKCRPCGEMFMTDTEVQKHRKLYCTQKKR